MLVGMMRSHVREAVVVGGCEVLCLSEREKEEAAEDREEGCQVDEEHKRQGVDQGTHETLHV